jgi:protein-tyrosine-phosphatase/DNA-binding transcriptional ArsR family regulator
MYLEEVARAPRDPSPTPIEFLQLVAEPVRWQLLRELARSDRRVNELTELSGRPQNLVSYHLGELRRAGLVAAKRSSADGRDSYYRIDLARCGQLLATTGSALHPGLRLELTADVPPPVAGRKTPRVLFLCTGNSARSQIAAALLEQLSNHTVEARSAGSHPKSLHPNAVRVMAERGVDISDRPTTNLRRYARMRFDVVVTLCDKVREVCPEFPKHPDRVHWSIADPALEGDTDAESWPAFERTAADLEERIRFLLPQLITTPTEEETHVR